jgi:hypothetical protein
MTDNRVEAFVEAILADRSPKHFPPPPTTPTSCGWPSSCGPADRISTGPTRSSWKNSAAGWRRASTTAPIACHSPPAGGPQH